jgi:chromosome partitioning protein
MITVIGNLKGGCGKSTVAFNLAVWLAAHKIRVNAYDLDPQGTLTDVTEVRNDEGITPLFSLHHGGKDLVESLQEKSGEVIVDIGVSDIEALKAALSVADRVLVPVPPSQADIWATQRFISIIRKAAGEREPAILVFVNRADTHHAITESDEAEIALADMEGATLIKHRLHQRTDYRRSFSEGLGVFEMRARGKAASEFIELARALYPETADKTRRSRKTRGGE